MSSNILAGERRWASARRTGMTVLGKVAVPKPINLPSQRLENHGVDPNVEIVPKGTLGWGSRPSSSTSNPWGSSSLSSTGEGYGSSPGHPSGRPSSSGSRPSTAGSEITHDRGGNAWGLGSRPSSASGTSASNQTSLTSLRPHSAETRPASSLTSRFAEPCTDTPARLPNVTAEGVGLASSLEKERFSLSSGDFPTLNSTTDGSIKNSDSRDQGSHSRPSSASGRVAEKDNPEMSQADVENGNVNAWKREGYRGIDDIHPTMEKWHGEPPRYHNSNVPHPQFDGWRGPSMNPPGVWYRGLPPGPPYGAPVAPGGFPIEPFPFYCPPQMPPSGLANSQPVQLPGPGSGPMGHPKNGEPYRPPMPDAFVRPGMPFRPGFYHGPMPFEGYYGPPMGYCNPNERDVPFKGMAAGPSAYNRFPARDSDPGPFNMADGNDSTYHNRTGKNSTNVKRSSEKVETSHFDEAPGRVLLKQNDGAVNQEGQSKANMATHSFPNPRRRSQAGSASRTKEWGAENNSDDDMYLRSAPDLHFSSGPLDDSGGSDSVTVRLKSYQSRDEVIDDQLKNLEPAASSSPVLPHVPLGRDGSLTSSGIARDPTLMQKIEVLNEKVRGSDCRNEVVYPSQWEEQKGAGAIIGEIMVPLEDKTSQLTAGPRRRYGVVRGKSDDNSKQKVNGPSGDDERTKLGSSVQASDLTPASSFHENRTNMTAVAAESLPEKNEVEDEVVDSTDSQTQRFKMRELAKQRALQLQREEEERTREQRAKALAKLEELNRRTPGDNSIIPNDEKVLPSGTSQEEQGPQALVESSRAVTKPLSQSPPLDITPGIRTQVIESSGGWGEEFADLDNQLPLQTLKTSPLDPAVLPSQSLPLKEELHTSGDSDCRLPLQFNEAGASRNKRSGYKQKQNVLADTNVRNKTAAKKAPQNNKELACSDIGIVSPGDVGASADSKMDDVPVVAVDPSSQQRRKSNRNSKNKHKPDSLPSASTVPSTTPDESNPADFSIDNEMSKATQSGMDKGLIQAPTNGSRAGGSSKQPSSFVVEGAQGSINMHRKSQQPRRGGRNQQTTRFTDKHHGNDNVVWAPVQPQNKAEPESDESDLKAVQDTAFSPKIDDQVQNNMKSKRAEMERYVPKPVAKELAQQGTLQQSASSSVGLSVSDTAAERVEPEHKTSGKQSDLVAGSVTPVSEFQMGDSRHNKQPKALGGWRQRGSLEQQQAKGGQNGSSSFTSKPSKAAQLSMAQNESSGPALSKTKAEQTSLRDLSASDSGPRISPQRRDQENASRAKRHAFKVERSIGNDREDEINFGSLRTDISHIQQQDPRLNQIAKSSSSKENRGLEERASSHWQPKSSQTSNIHGGGSNSGANTVAAEAGVTGKKGNQSLPEEHISQHVKQIKEIDSRQNPSAPKSNVLLEGNVGHQGHRRERKFSSSKGQPYFQNEDSVGADDYMSRENQNKQPIPSDNRRSRYQNVRPIASHELRGDLDQERHGQNRHYEYQPIGTKDDRKFENPEDGSRNVGPRYKERGQSHSRRGRGQFHGRQSSNVQLGAGYG